MQILQEEAPLRPDAFAFSLALHAVSLAEDERTNGSSGCDFEEGAVVFSHDFQPQLYFPLKRIEFRSYY